LLGAIHVISKVVVITSYVPLDKTLVLPWVPTLVSAFFLPVFFLCCVSLLPSCLFLVFRFRCGQALCPSFESYGATRGPHTSQSGAATTVPGTNNRQIPCPRFWTGRRRRGTSTRASSPLLPIPTHYHLRSRSLSLPPLAS
jgi:hypothetical protein